MTINRYFGVMLLAILCALSSCENTGKSIDSHDNNNSSLFEWHQSHLGGGGYIVGLIQNPKDPEILYARCDVAGVFRSNNGGRKWKLINNGLTECHHSMVESIALNPEQPNVLFRGSGEARGHKMIGSIHKSIDGGDNWYEVTDKVDFCGNGPNRMFGERIQVDPNDQNFVVAGGFSSGVYVSHDMGETWSYSGLKGEPIVCVIFHPYQKDKIYIGTVKHNKFKDYLDPSLVTERPEVGRLYVSNNKGKTWNLLNESSEMEFVQLAFNKDDANTIYCAGNQYGIYRSDDGGHQFHKIMNGLPKEVPYLTIEGSPHKKGLVYTVPKREGEDKHVPLVPLYYSTDKGDTWKLLSNYNKANFTTYPSYIKTEEWVGWSIAKFKVDLVNPQKLYMSNWYGVSVSEDGGKNWKGNYFDGMETVCIENVVASTVTPGEAAFVLPDHRPIFTEDFGKTYKEIEYKSIYRNSTTVVKSIFDKNRIIYGGKIDWSGNNGSAIHVSRDGGENFEIVKTFKGDLTIQAMREDINHKGTIYAYVDGEINRGAGLYKSEDFGENWIFINSPVPKYINILPFNKAWVENELLPIVVGQNKNGVGTNQLLDLDPNQDGCIYFGECTEGIFRSFDGGSTWKNVSGNLPFHSDTCSVLRFVQTDKNKKGLVYAGFIRDGLWCSKNSGETWEKIFPKENNRFFNASSLAIGNSKTNELFVCSEPLYLSPAPSAVYYSNDGGESWQSIYKGEFGALRWKALAMDAGNNVLYGGTNGNGAFYAIRK